MATRLSVRHNGHEEEAAAHRRAVNDLIKYGFWVLIGVLLLTWSLIRLLRHVWCRHKQTSSGQTGNKQHYKRLDPALDGTTRSTVSALRGLTYTRSSSSGPWTRYIRLPAVGRAIFLAFYWIFILASLWTNVIIKSRSEVYGIEWEIVGFRAAWVSTMQLPLLYATGCRFNIISLMTGISHERLNWFHRWVAGTVFMTLIVHWAFFYREWDITGFVKQEIQLMPMVTWGFAAWGAIGLMVLSGFAWFRDKLFEIWLFSHIVLAWAVLALSYTHTHCTTYFVAASVGMLVFDMLGRAILAIHNMYAVARPTWLPYFGNKAKIEVLDKDYVCLTIENPTFRWRAGQHAYITVPKARWFQSHPFTILGIPELSRDSSSIRIIFNIKKHTGFTQTLHDLASNSDARHVRVFVQGPYGNPPCLYSCNVVVCIATGNRASFVVPLLTQAPATAPQITHVALHWIVPNESMISWYKGELQQCISAHRHANINIQVNIYVTRTPELAGRIPVPDNDVFSIGRDSIDSVGSLTSLVEKDYATTDPEHDDHHVAVPDVTDHEDDQARLSRKDVEEHDKEKLLPEPQNVGYGLTGTSTAYYRPSAEEMITPMLENTKGSVMVVAACLSTLAAGIANSVARESWRSGRDVRLWTEDNGS